MGEIVEQGKAARLRQWSFYALLAEAFFIALYPPLAMAALGVGVAATLWRWKYVGKVDFVRTPLDKPVILFFIIAGCSVAVSPDPWFSLYNFTCLLGMYLLSFELLVQTVKSENELKKLVWALGISFGLCALYGIWQYVFGIDTADMKWVDGDAFPELKKRIFSTWINPNIFAGYLNEAICALFAFLLGERDKRCSWLCAGLIVAGGFCLVMTYARGAIFSLALVLFGYGALKDRRVLFAVVAIGALVLALNPALLDRLTSLLTRMDTSAEMRLALWESSAVMVLDHPLLGIGWGAYFMVYHSYDFYINDPSVLIVHAHNLYLNYAAETGLLGASCYFWFFFGGIYYALKDMDKSASAFLRQLRLGLALAVISVALGGLTDNVVFNIPTSMLLWMTIGMILRARAVADGDVEM